MGSGVHAKWARVAFRGYYAPADGAYALYVAGTNGCDVRR